MACDGIDTRPNGRREPIECAIERREKKLALARQAFL
jgi:hypothetical protein